MNRAYLLLAASLLVNAAGLNAQFKYSKFGAGIVVGGAKLQGDIDGTRPGASGGIILRYAPIPHFGISAISTYSRMTSGLDAIHTEVFDGSISGNFFLFPHSRFKPFLSLGLSTFYYTAKNGKNQPLHRLDGSAVAGWEKALQAGAGFEVATGQRWGLNTIGSYTFSDKDELDGIVQGQNDGFFTGLIGLVHYFYAGESKERFTKRPARADVQEISKHRPATSIRRPAPATQTSIQKTKEALFMGGIDFKPGTANIEITSKQQLYKIYRFLLTNPQEEITLLAEPISINAGSSAKKQIDSLIVERARSIKRYLVDLGIDPSRIIVD